MAEGFDGLGKTARGAALAHEVNNRAVELGLVEIQKWAEGLIAGKSMFSIARQLQENSAASPDEGILDTSDEEIERFAQYYIEAIGLPQERLKHVVKDMVFMRKNAELRQRFCRHLVLVQNLEHTWEIETVYSIDPPRVFRCLRYGFQSDYECTHWESLLFFFHLNYCSRCPSGPRALPMV